VGGGGGAGGGGGGGGGGGAHGSGRIRETAGSRGVVPGAEAGLGAYSRENGRNFAPQPVAGPQRRRGRTFSKSSIRLKVNSIWSSSLWRGACGSPRGADAEEPPPACRTGVKWVDEGRAILGCGESRTQRPCIQPREEAAERECASDETPATVSTVFFGRPTYVDTAECPSDPPKYAEYEEERSPTGGGWSLVDLAGGMLPPYLTNRARDRPLDSSSAHFLFAVCSCLTSSTGRAPPALPVLPRPEEPCEHLAPTVVLSPWYSAVAERNSDEKRTGPFQQADGHRASVERGEEGLSRRG